MDDETREEIIAYLCGSTLPDSRDWMGMAGAPGTSAAATTSTTTTAAPPRMPISRGLAAALDAFEQKTTVGTIGTKIVAGELRNPVVPVITKKEFDGFFCRPDEGAGERPCLMLKKCTAYDISGWMDVPGSGPLKEFRLTDWPDPVGARHLGVAGSEAMPCISCIMKSQTMHINEFMRTKTEPNEIAQAFQVKVGPGEFCIKDCHPAVAWGKFTGAPYPVPKWSLDMFAWIEEEVPGKTEKRARVKNYFRVGPPVRCAAASAAPGGQGPMETF